MEQLNKVNSYQLYLFWKNFSISLLVLVGVLTLSKILPAYLAPVGSLVCVAILYSILFNNRSSNEYSCMMGTYCIFVSLITYTVVTMILNILFAFKITHLPRELIFLNEPFIPSLVLIPICFFSFVVIWFRRRKLAICNYCRLHHGDFHERGKLGHIINYESRFQIINLMIVFGVLSVVIWTYYLVFFINISTNSRDWYIFTWLVIIFLLLDELYFIFRYYNLYLDLKENNELISPDDLLNMESKIYLRFYVICENEVYVDTHGIDPKQPYREVIDTPFFTKRSVTGINVAEVKRIITRLTGIDNGELRFFFGRRAVSSEKQSILRYFYFLDPEPDGSSPKLRMPGEWMNYELVKKIYSENPGLLADISVSDTTRLATIMITSKIFNDKGVRKSKIKSYTPSFNLIDVRRSDIDFQDDKWLKISMFNSDVRFFHLRSWFRRITRRSPRNKAPWIKQ